MSDHALHVQMLFDSSGIEIPAEFHAMPDHLCLELEYAALLLELHQDDRYRTFIHEHLNWVEELLKEAEKQGIHEYYLQVLRLTAQFLSWELRR